MPEPLPSQGSATGRRLRRAWYWLRALVLWQDAPTAAAYAELLALYHDASRRLLRAQAENAVLRAEADALREGSATMGLLVERDRERIRAEAAGHAAARERAVNSAAATRSERAD